MDIDVRKYITKALKNSNVQIDNILIVGTGEKDSGYASDMTFATVLVTEVGTKKVVEVVVKSSKKGFIETNRSAYEREAYIYKIILPEFTRFQKENSIKNVFSSVPLCYKTISDEDAEVIVMENLKKNGYVLYDRKKPLNLEHLKLVLREYGKFHAISFAMRKKNKECFEKIVNNFEDVTLDFFNGSFRQTIQQCFERACDVLKNMGHTKSYEMCKKILKNGADVAMMEILETVEPVSAVLHGDCWNNNFLYKYEDKDCRVPSEVAIVDWQISRLHSPVLDLSYFIYSTSSVEQLKHFDELLDTYYSSFSAFLMNLGCDSEELFSYSTLRKHWKKYSLYGVLAVTSFLHLTICDKEEAPELTDAESIGEKIMNVKITDETEYRKRLIAVIDHYCNYNQ